MSIKDKILKVDDRPIIKEAVPEWGVDVFIRGMESADRDDWEIQVLGDGTTTAKNVRARLVVRCLYEDEPCTKRIFDDADAPELGHKSGKVLDRLYAYASRLSGVGDVEVQQLVKNSVSSLGAASSSD